MKKIWNGDIILAKYKLLGNTYIIGKCEQGDIDWPEGGYALYVYDKNYCRKWKQIYGHPKLIPVEYELYHMIRKKMDEELVEGIENYFASIGDTGESIQGTKL